MARNTRRSRGLKKLAPAPMTMTFEMGSGGTSYIDISQCASILNRRFYRQGLNWAVAGMTIYANGTNKTVRVATLQKNWATFNSWKKGFALWREMNDQVLDTEPGIQGKYSDFKIFMDRSHMSNYTDNGEQTDITDSAGHTLLPVVCSPSDGTSLLPSTTNREWVYSQYIIPQAGGAAPSVSANITMNGGSGVGSTVPSVGLISGYGLSRARPNTEEPNAAATSADAWMNALFSLADTDDDIRDNLVEDNDKCPYPVAATGSVEERMPGGEFNLAGLELVSPPMTSAAGTDYSGRVTVPGFTAPCGLIYIKNDGAVTVQVHLVPGDHKGYMAVPMQEM